MILVGNKGILEKEWEQRVGTKKECTVGGKNQQKWTSSVAENTRCLVREP